MQENARECKMQVPRSFRCRKRRLKPRDDGRSPGRQHQPEAHSHGICKAYPGNLCTCHKMHHMPPSRFDPTCLHCYIVVYIRTSPKAFQCYPNDG